MQIKLLCIGDIVGKPGRHVLAEHLGKLVKEHEIDCVIANAENAAGGSGLTPQSYDKIRKYGVNLMTLGDHVFRKRDIIDTLNTSDCIVRGANLSPKAAGKDVAVYTTAKGPQVAVVTLLGRMYMNMQSDNPFLIANTLLARLASTVKIVVVEIHAEATSEKIAMGWYLNGRASVVFGTHTHVVTADETILTDGTAYITDIGMTGAHKGVLGRNIEPVVKSLVTQMPFAYSLATDDLRLNGIIVTVNADTGKALAIERVCAHGQKDRNGGNYDSSDGKPEQLDRL